MKETTGLNIIYINVYSRTDPSNNNSISLSFEFKQLVNCQFQLQLSHFNFDHNDFNSNSKLFYNQHLNSFPNSAYIASLASAR
jgi:hypothetical protein